MLSIVVASTNCQRIAQIAFIKVHSQGTCLFSSALSTWVLCFILAKKKVLIEMLLLLERDTEDDGEGGEECLLGKASGRSV